MTPIDKLIGANLKRLRMEKGLTQEEVAARSRPAINPGQIAKYEGGYDRITAGRLYDLAKIISCKVGDFYDGALLLALNKKHQVELPGGKTIVIIIPDMFEEQPNPNTEARE